MTANDLVDKVARALWESDRHDWISPDYSQHEFYIRGMAKVAIAAVLDAIAEPSEATWKIINELAQKLRNGDISEEGQYRAMIAALRKEVG